MIAVEFDSELARKLPGQFPGKNLIVMHEDILQFDLLQLPAGWLWPMCRTISPSKIVQKLMTADNKPSIAVLLVQKKLQSALQLSLATQSILAISAQVYAQALWAVWSLLNSLRHHQSRQPGGDTKTREQPLVALVDEKAFFRMVKAGFSAKRKKLRSSLSGGLGISKQETEDLWPNANISPTFVPKI